MIHKADSPEPGEIKGACVHGAKSGKRCQWNWVLFCVARIGEISDAYRGVLNRKVMKFVEQVLRILIDTYSPKAFCQEKRIECDDHVMNKHTPWTGTEMGLRFSDIRPRPPIWPIAASEDFGLPLLGLL